MADAEQQLLANLAERQSIANSFEYASSHGVAPDRIVGIIKSLEAAGLIEAEVSSKAALKHKL